MKTSIYILFLIVFSIKGYSQFVIPDTKVSRGDIFELPISWAGTTSDSNYYSFKLKYDLNMIDVKLVTVEPKNNSNFGFDYQIVLDENQSYIQFDGSTFQEPFNAIIELEALAASDTITYLEIDSLNQEPYNFDNTVSSIFIPDPLISSEQNSVGEPYPNPFFNQFKVNISINESVDFSAKIFNYETSLIALEDKISGVEMTLLDENSNPVSFGNLNIGEYQLLVNVDDTYLSNGFYFLALNMNGTLSYKPIIMEK
ncbi:hypothetical protein OAQ99_06555 [Candidatus Kapabacteria bacterium]|nr:hypothetical protein [Candidatus Kapabacteria bacterium]